ncbi:uncharacterized protein G6M90_00g067700 [Metarhizium brunneum]|uniref:Yeast cell wall synthesis Kre9/Knh1-like N-terminal domain-containing protein n=1 Tax=Metarhizium brunneum TaxID=500148 RepID=A0A7D5Z3B2_9HYPO|nr:hypothetical protein G6M90_00g067700 [Metarhizium brunneum]
MPLPALFVWALQINSPGHAATGSDVTVTWSHVDTDPAKFDLNLWNGAAQSPAVNRLLASGVPVAADAVRVSVPCGIPSSGAYQLLAVDGANSSDVYARSGQCSVAVVGCTSSATSTARTTRTSLRGVQTDATTASSSALTNVTSTPSGRGTSIPMAGAAQCTAQWLSIAGAFMLAVVAFWL